MAKSPLFVLCLTLALFRGLDAFAAGSADEIAKQLAGTRSREWVFIKFETFMGPGNHCKAGESYRFNVDHHVTISKCVNGQVHDEVMEWSIPSQDAMDTWIKVGNDSFLLILWDTPHGHFMALRTKPNVKAVSVVDKTFHREEN